MCKYTDIMNKRRDIILVFISEIVQLADDCHEDRDSTVKRAVAELQQMSESKSFHDFNYKVNE